MQRFALVLVVLAACVDPGASPGADPTDESSLEQDATTPFANDKPAFDFFVAKGLTPFQAAGIVGNLDQESGVSPTSVQYGGGPGRGIAQWSVGGRWDTSSHDNVLWYAGTKGESATSLNLQLEFIWYELTQIGYGYTQLQATTNVTDATIAFMDRYEICGTCASSQRVAYAKAVLAAYGQTPGYGAAYVSQSWPLATMPLTIHCGEKVAASLVLKNTGAMAWNSSTKLGTTMPRDRASAFAGDDWLAPNRAAAITGTVAPGAKGTFAFSFTAPSGTACVPGTYHEHFGLVQESVAWFSDTAEGGPPDDQIEALIEVVPADPNAPTGSGDSPGGENAGGGCATGGGQGGAVAGLLVACAALGRRRRRA